MKVKLNGNDFYQVTCPFGSVDPLHPKGYTGIDLAINEGTKLFSPTNGVVEKIVDYGNNNIGKGIIIKEDDGHSVILGHLSDNSQVHVGQQVQTGDFIGLSGNTGRSTGSHLHLGMKDENGNFINPEPLLNERDLGDVIFQKEGLLTKASNTDSGGFLEGIKGFGDFLGKWNETGSFWVAMYDKPFSQVMGEFFKELGRDIGIFILGNADLLLLAPAIVFMLGTFMVGKNKFSKWIVPLWFGYFICTVFHKMLL